MSKLNRFFGIVLLLITSSLVLAQAMYTDLRVGNIFLDGNTISTLDTNGDLTLLPNGTGGVVIGSGGTDGQLLTSQSGKATWQDAPVSTTLSAKGDIQTHNGTDNAALSLGTAGQILSVNSGTTTGLEWIDLPVSTTLTTKGDLQGHNGTSNVRVPVGTDGQVLTADSSAPSGVSYQDAAATMQDAYDNSTDGDIVVDATRGSVQIQDASTAIGNPLFEVLTNDALTTYFSASANGITLENGVTINGFLDEDDMASDSASSVPTQQSVKAYVDQRSPNSRMNLLEDPSFEKGTTSEVECLGASKAIEAYDPDTNPTAVVEVTPYNTKSLKVTTSSVSDGLKNFCEVSKSVNSEWTTSTNVIKAFRYNIPESNVYDYKLVSYADGAIDEYSDGTDVEIPLVKSGNWELAVIPTMSGTTSNGWRLEYANNGQTAVNENFYLDELEIRAAGSSDSFRVDDTDTDWVSFTPTFVNLSLGDGTLRNFSYARAGDSILIKGEIIFGSTTSVSGRIGVTLPSSLSADLEDNFSQMSNVFMYDSSATSNSTTGRTTILTSSPTIVNIDALSGITSATTPFSWASGDVLTIEPTNIPIQGWSTGNVDAMRQTQELVKVEAYGNGGGAYTSGNSITFDTEAKDNFNAWATNTFTSPRDTCYRVDGGLLFDTPVAGIITVSGGRLADGTLSGRKLGEADSRTNPGFGGEICANSGDTLTFSINASANMVDDSGGFHYLVIKEDPDLRDAILKLKDTQISKVEDKYTETEKEWGKWNGQQLYRRCFTVGSDVTATGTLFTWDAGLRPVNSLNWQGSLYTLLSHTQNGSSTDRVFIFYNSTDGDIEIAADGTASWGAYTGTSFCMDYTK